MRNIVIAGCVAAAITAAGGAGALVNTAKRAVPGASIGRHAVQHHAEHHAARHPVRRKPVVPPP